MFLPRTEKHDRTRTHSPKRAKNRGRGARRWSLLPKPEAGSNLVTSNFFPLKNLKKSPSSGAYRLYVLLSREIQKLQQKDVEDDDK